MRYKIISANNTDSLEIKVECELRLGWKPQGGVCKCPESNTYYQAMVME